MGVSVSHDLSALCGLRIALKCKFLVLKLTWASCCLRIPAYRITTMTHHSTSIYKMSKERFSLEQQYMPTCIFSSAS